MQITIDTSNLSDMDIAMLAFLAGSAEEADAPVEDPKPAAKPAAKTAAKPAAKAVTKIVVAEVVAEVEAEVEADIEAQAPTMADAVAAATILVAAGGAGTAKEALSTVGVKRVSEMKAEDIPAFLAALEA